MNGARWARQVLPRLAPGQTWAATASNTVGLLTTALLGAGLVHLLAYHLPAGVPFGPRWDRQALALLVHRGLAEREALPVQRWRGGPRNQPSCICRGQE